MNKKSCLVTGAAGFLGSLVCEKLLAEGNDVLGIDTLLTGNITNLDAISGHKNFQFQKADVRNFTTADSFSEIWNLASPASPPIYQIDPVGTLLVNVVGTANMLELARRSGALFFQASTSEIYGDPEVHPQTESYRGSVNTVGVRACYDEGKRAAETLCYDFARLYGVDVRVARIFNTYGPKMDPQDGRVVSNFIVSALAGEPLEVYGTGSQTRSFCFRDDLVEGFFRLMRYPANLDGPVNLGNPDEFTILELANIILEMTGSKSAIIYKNLPQDDPKQRCPDISLARRKLGWEPKVNLGQGLEKTINYFVNLPKLVSSDG